MSQNFKLLLIISKASPYFLKKQNVLVGNAKQLRRIKINANVE